MVEKFINSLADDKKDHVLLGIIWGFPWIFLGFLIDLYVGGFTFTFIGGGIGTLKVGGKEIVHDWLLKKGNPEFAVIGIEQPQKIALAMPEIDRVTKSFGKTNSQFCALNLTLSEITPSRNIRQLAAQIENKFQNSGSLP